MRSNGRAFKFCRNGCGVTAGLSNAEIGTSHILAFPLFSFSEFLPAFGDVPGSGIFNRGLRGYRGSEERNSEGIHPRRPRNPRFNLTFLFLLSTFYFRPKGSMNEDSTAAQPTPADNPARNLKIARPDTDENLPHIGLVGDTYTVLLSGADTDGRYCLIDMHIPPGGGPPPHRHDFEESFTVLEGEIEATFRGEKSIVHAGQTVSIPANAPHSFTNVSRAAARLLCICAPAGQEEFFAQVGVTVPTRRSTPPALDQTEQAELLKKAQELAPRYRTELLPP